MHYHGHRERLRGRLKDSSSKLADYEILELLLGHVLLRSDTKPLAKELLERFQTIRGVLDAKPAELEAIKGFGPSLGNFWLLLREVFSRYVESDARQRAVLASPREVGRMARQRLAACPHEETWVAYVDSQNRLILWEQLRKGTLDHTPFYPRDILEKGLTVKASGFILVHNHPGGNGRPSTADKESSSILRASAQTIAMRFVDHLIVTEDACYSIAQEGFILMGAENV